MPSTIFTQTSLLAALPIAPAAVARCLTSSAELSASQVLTLRDAFAPASAASIADPIEVFTNDCKSFGESIKAGSEYGMSIQNFFANYSHQLTTGSKPQILEPVGMLEDWEGNLPTEVFGEYIAGKPLLRRALEAEIAEIRTIFAGVETTDAEVKNSAIKQIILAELADLGQASNNKGDEEFSRPYRGDFSQKINGKHPVALFLWDKLLNRFKNWQSEWRQHMLVVDASRYLSPTDGSLIRGTGRVNTRNIEGQLFVMLRDNLPTKTAGVQLLGEAIDESAPGDIQPASAVPQEIKLPPWLAAIADDFIGWQQNIWDNGPTEENKEGESKAILAVYEHRDRPGFLEYIRRPINSAGIYSWTKTGHVLAWLNNNLSKARGEIARANPIAVPSIQDAGQSEISGRASEEVQLLQIAEMAAIFATLKFEDVK